MKCRVYRENELESELEFEVKFYPPVVVSERSFIRHMISAIDDYG